MVEIVTISAGFLARGCRFTALRCAFLLLVVSFRFGIAEASLGGVSCSELFLSGEIRSSSAKVRRYDASKTLSQKVRDNAPFYWAEAREKNVMSELPEGIQASVIAVGDLHSGNFSPVFVPGKGVIYSIFDVKDFGYAPAILDINRLILNTVAVASRRRDLTLEEQSGIARTILRQYVKGLEHENFRLTKKYEDEMPSPKEYRKMMEKLADKKTDDDGYLEVDREATFPLSMAAQKLNTTVAQLRTQLENEMRTHLGWGHLLDAVANVRDRGGSRESVRILATFKSNDGKIVIKEFKQIAEPAVAEYSQQPSVQDIQVEASRYLDYDLGEVFPVVQLKQSLFIMRDKKVEPITVPYRQKSREDFDFLVNLARDHAVWVGTFHGRQLFANHAGGPRGMARSIRDNEASIVAKLLRFNRDQLRRLEAEAP